jgi:hypothetical protein
MAPARWLYRSALSALELFCAGLVAGAKMPSGPVEFGNQMIGTAISGNTFPGAVLPFGMVAFSPEEVPTNEAHRSLAGGYAYRATQIRGVLADLPFGSWMPGKRRFCLHAYYGRHE